LNELTPRVHHQQDEACPREQPSLQHRSRTPLSIINQSLQYTQRLTLVLTLYRTSKTFGEFRIGYSGQKYTRHRFQTLSTKKTLPINEVKLIRSQAGSI